MTERDDALKAWLATEAAKLGFDPESMAPASSDAGFRR